MSKSFQCSICTYVSIFATCKLIHNSAWEGGKTTVNKKHSVNRQCTDKKWKAVEEKESTVTSIMNYLHCFNFSVRHWKSISSCMCESKLRRLNCAQRLYIYTYNRYGNQCELSFQVKYRFFKLHDILLKLKLQQQNGRTTTTGKNGYSWNKRCEETIARAFLWLLLWMFMFRASWKTNPKHTQTIWTQQQRKKIVSTRIQKQSQFGR